MVRPGEGPRRWCALGVALLCLVAWLGSALHVALEPHDYAGRPVAVEHAHDHDHDHEHPGGERHDADDHLIAVTSPAAGGSLELVALTPRTALVSWESRPTAPAPAPPRHEVEPGTDPPPSSLRTRAPPVG